MISIIIIAVLIIFLLKVSLNYFVYFCAARGLLERLWEKYNDILDEDEIRELRDSAVRRTVAEFFGKNENGEKR